MNQTEKRRKKLLEQTRNLYSDSRSIPPVHPRYRSMYRNLYDEEYEEGRGTFGLRTGICMLLFLGYVAMEYRGTSFLGITNMQVLENIIQNFL